MRNIILISTIIAIISISITGIWSTINIGAATSNKGLESDNNNSIFNLVYRLKRAITILPKSSDRQQRQCYPGVEIDANDDNDSSNINSSKQSIRILRIGILGASQIAKLAVIIPASRFCSVTDTGQEQSTFSRSSSPLLGARVEAVAARDYDRAAIYAKKYGIPHVFHTYEDLIQSNDDIIDAVYIGIPTLYHHKYALQALNAGKHVLLEKPMTVTSQEAHELRTTAEARGLVLMEAFHYKYHPLFQRLLRLVHQNDNDGKEIGIGQIHNIEILISMPSPKALFERLVVTPSKQLLSRLRLLPSVLMTTTATMTTPHEHRKMLDRWAYATDAICELFGTKDTATATTVVKVKDATLDSSEGIIQLQISTKDNKVMNDDSSSSNVISVKIIATKRQVMWNHMGWFLRIYGESGRIDVSNWWFPSLYHSLKVTQYNNGSGDNDYGGSSSALASSIVEESHYGVGNDYGVTTFEMQLREFVRACANVGIATTCRSSSSVSNAEGFATRTRTPSEGVVLANVENMKIVDDVFRVAGIYGLSLASNNKA